MTGLTGRGPKDSYKELLKVTEVGGIKEALSTVTDGDGVATPLSISTNAIDMDGDISIDGVVSVDGAITLRGIKWPSAAGGSGKMLQLNEAGNALGWHDAMKPSELILKANFVGQVTETVGSSRFYPPSSITITKVYCSISSPGTGSNEFDVKVNGVSIFPNTKPSIGANQFRSVDYLINHNVTSTSYITVDVTRASGSDLVVYIVYQ